MKSTINSIIVTILFVVPIVGSFSVYGQETTDNVKMIKLNHSRTNKEYGK